MKYKYQPFNRKYPDTKGKTSARRFFKEEI